MELEQAYKVIQDLGIEVKGKMFCCPFHNDKNPSASFYLNKYHNQVEFHCFSCGKSMEASKMLSSLKNKESDNLSDTKSISNLSISPDLLASRANCSFLLLLDGELEFPVYQEYAFKALEYLRSRGFDKGIIEEHQIGLIVKKDLKELIKDKWVDYGNYFLTFPIRNENGNVITLQFEDIENKQKYFLTGKPRDLWLSSYPPDKEGINVVCEGIFDALSFSCAGMNAIALLGNPSKESKERLRDFKNLILALDNDIPGKKFKEELTKELYPYSHIIEVEYPEGIKDPNELLQKEGKEGIVKMLANVQEIDLFPPLEKTIDIMIARYKEDIDQAIKIPNDFKYLNSFFSNGLIPGTYALAGLPSVGKTTWLNQLSDSLANDDIISVYFLTEEPGYRLLNRTKKSKNLTSFTELKQEKKIIQNRIVFEMTPDYTAEYLKDIVAGIKNRTDKKLVFIVDSLQALRLSKDNERLDIREKTVLKTEYLSYIARDLGIPVIFTSFVARAQYNDGKKPNISVFKESGDIEYLIDVGIVLSVKMEELTDKNNNDELDVKLHILKNRFGKVGDESLRLIKNQCKFEGANE